MKKIYIIVLSGLITFIIMAGCRQAPAIQAIDNSHYLDKNIPEKEIAKAIMRGAASKGWRTKKIKDGLIEANILVRNKHFVAVDIPYNPKGYKILYKNSRNMDYNPDTHGIHGNYLKWTKILSDRIDYELLNMDVSANQSNYDMPKEKSPSIKKKNTFSLNIEGKSIYIAPEIIYTSKSRVSTAIKQECTIPQALSDNIIKKSTTKGIDIKSKRKIKDNDIELKIEILDAVSAGNAAIGHSKYMVIQGYLVKNNVKYASFKAARHSGGGVFGSYRSSCSVLARITNALGDDVGNWLLSPMDNARLGDVQLIR